MRVPFAYTAFGGGAEASRAIGDISFHVDSGETVAVVGESGLGKSVTALSILRLLCSGGRIMSGAIDFRRKDGTVVDLAQQPERMMRAIRGDEISMIFQEPMTSLNPVVSIGHQIAETIVQHQGKSMAAAIEQARLMLELVRIPDSATALRRHPHELSGGMRQRVMIAMALCCRPSLLIANEPTTALDVTIQAQILSIIRSLQTELEMAVLFISHDTGVVAEMADRVVVTQRGALIETGAVRQIYQAPAEPYTEALLAAAPRLGSMAARPIPSRRSPPARHRSRRTRGRAIRRC